MAAGEKGFDCRWIKLASAPGQSVGPRTTPWVGLGWVSLSLTHVVVLGFSTKLKYKQVGGGIRGKQLVLVLAPGLGTRPGLPRLGGGLAGLGGHR